MSSQVAPILVCGMRMEPGGGQRKVLVMSAPVWWVKSRIKWSTFSLCLQVSLQWQFSSFNRKVKFTAKGRNATPHVNTLLLLHPTAAVQFVMVGILCAFAARLNGSRRHIVCSCFVDCGVNGHNFPNGAVVPSGDRCQKCTCEVCPARFVNYSFFNK